MSSAPVVMRGEVWFAALDPVRDHEQGGERPCLVVSNNQMNASPADLVVVLPITTTDRRLPTRVAMMPDEACLDRASFVICEQVRTISKGRLRRRCGDAAPTTMRNVQAILRQILPLDTRM